MAQGPNYGLQGGSTWVISDEGTLTIGAGGSISVESGGVISVAAGGSIVNAGEQSITGNTTIPSGGTLTVAAGGSIQNSGVIAHLSGAKANILSGGSIVVAAGGSVQQAGAQHVTGLTNIASGGSINVASGGSIQIASGGQFHAVAATGLSAPAGMLMNGTVMKWAMGTATLTSGVGTLGIVGFTRVLAATANNILGEASGNGSATSVHVDLSLSGAGSVIFRAIAGTLGYGGNQVIAYQAIGT